MSETSLKKIIALIDEHDEVGLRRVLEEDNSEINQYHDMAVDSKLAVRVSPLQFAVKVKAPKCVEILLEYGADVKMKLKTPENKTLPITALALAEGEREVALKNDRMSDIGVYDEIVRLIKEHEKKKKKKKKAKVEEIIPEEPPTKLVPLEPNGESEPAGKPGKDNATPMTSSVSLNNIDKINASGNNAGGDLVTSASMGSSSMPTLLVPPSPSSVVDMHKLTLRTTQSQMAIKRLEEKNEQFQKEIDILRQDMELLKKLVVSLDLSKGEALELESSNKRKTVHVTKTSSEKSLPKSTTTDTKKQQQSKPPKSAVASTPSKKEPVQEVEENSDDSEPDSSASTTKKKGPANAVAASREKKEKTKPTPRDDQKTPSKKSDREEKPSATKKKAKPKS